MMISPETFIVEYKNKKYSELIKIRDVLIRDIRRFERKKDEEHKEGNMIIICDPSPEVVYQVNLQYLGKLCELIAEKYNQEYVWGDLSDEKR
jgi:hypothetical protein